VCHCRVGRDQHVQFREHGDRVQEGAAFSIQLLIEVKQPAAHRGICDLHRTRALLETHQNHGVQVSNPFGHEHKRKQFPTPSHNGIFEIFQQLLPIGIISKNGLTRIATGHAMINPAGIFDA
jgi:hypothetical protein